MKHTILTTSLTTALAAAICAPAHGGISASPLSSFGGGDGWRAPGEILVGDAAGTAGATTYNYLGTGSLERGLAYNPGFDKLVLVSRNGGINLRQLDPLSGIDLGPVTAPGAVVTGGTFAGSMVACGNDGATYLANLTTGAATSAFKVYKWADIGDPAPTVLFNSTISGFSATARLGDSFDVIDGPVCVAGCGSGIIGYAVITPGSAAAVASFAPAGPATGDFRLGITFGPGGANDVWGRQTSGTTIKRTTYTGTTGTLVGTYTGPANVNATGEAAMDVTVVGGVKLLATMDMSSAGGVAARPTVRIYDVTTPATPVLAATITTATGTLATNGNAAGSLHWGAISGGSAKLYAMATNQGIQAFTVTVTPDATPPVIAASPGNRTVLERGQTTFTVSATGTAPFTYVWSKDGSPIGGATSASYTLNPVTAAHAGSYTCRVTNGVGFADSTAAVLTVSPSVNTPALTACWSLAPGSLPWLSASGDTERGVDYNPANNHVYIASRNPSTQVYVVNGTTGATVNQLDVTGVAGGNFTLMFPGVNADGAVYVCNLSNTGDGSSFKIYKWVDDAAATVPVAAYSGNPIGSRIGDSFDVRGSGASTECVAGARNTNQFVLFNETSPGVLTPTAITVAGVPNSGFGLAIAFGEGNTVWGKGDGGSLYYCSYDAASGTGSIIASYTTGIPSGTNPLGVDTVNRCIAMIDTGNSDNVRLFSYSADAVPVLTLLDQEFFPTDNANANHVGSVYAGSGKVYALDTNNGVMCFSTLKPALPELGAITPGPGANFSVQISGTAGFNYVVESSSDHLTWTPFAIVPFTSAMETVQLPTTAPRQLYRARLGP